MPRMFCRHGKNTPLNVPNFCVSVESVTETGVGGRGDAGRRCDAESSESRCTSNKSVRNLSINAARSPSGNNRGSRPSSAPSMIASTSSSGGAISSDDNRLRRGLGNGNARLLPFGDGDASKWAKTSVVSSSNEELRLCIVRSVPTSSGGGVLDSSPPPFAVSYTHLTLPTILLV